MDSSQGQIELQLQQRALHLQRLEQAASLVPIIVERQQPLAILRCGREAMDLIEHEPDLGEGLAAHLGITIGWPEGHIAVPVCMGNHAPVLCM